MEICTRLLDRGNDVTICWVPAHHGVTGNEVADKQAKAAANGTQHNNVPDDYRRETSPFGANRGWPSLPH